MKIYIVGSVASGKTTLANRISVITGVPCAHLDDVVHEKNPSEPSGNRKRSPEERDALFQEIFQKPDFLIEDVGRECFLEGMRQVDTILLLDPPFRVVRARIFRRWLRQKLGLEACGYKPNLAMLRSMCKWARNFQTGADGTKARVARFPEKTIALRGNREIEAYLEALTSSK